MKKLLYFLLLFPILANAQVNGSIQYNSATGDIRYYNPSGPVTKSVAPVSGVGLNGQILVYDSVLKQYVPTTGSLAPIGIQDSLTKKANRTFDNVASGAISQNKINGINSFANPQISFYKTKTNQNTITDFARDGSALAQLGDYLFLLGGWNPDQTPDSNNEVYRINKTVTGSTQLSDASWPDRHTFGYGVKSNSVYVFGGDLVTGSYQKDSWRGDLQPDSTISWTLLNNNVPWGERVLFGSTVHNGEFYVIGGQKSGLYSDGALTDVWKSKDGITWTQIATGLTQFGQNMYGTVTSYNGYIYTITGGRYDTPTTSGTFTKKVWRSIDGINWESRPDVPFSGRQYADVTVSGGLLWLVGGVTGGTLPSDNNGEVWAMDKFEQWSLIDTVSPRHASGVSYYNGNMAIVTGNMWNDAYLFSPYKSSVSPENNTLVARNSIGGIRVSSGGGIVGGSGDGVWSIFDSGSETRLDSNNDISFYAGSISGSPLKTLSLSSTQNVSVPNGAFSIPTVGYAGGIGFNYASLSETINSSSTILGNAVYAGTSSGTIRRIKNDPANFIRLNYQDGIAFHTNLTSTVNSNVSETTSQVASFDLSGNFKVNSLAGTGTRMVVANASGVTSTQAIPGGGGGSVTGVNVAAANGLNGSSDGASVVPTLTLGTTVNSPVVAANGTAFSAATTTGTGSTVVLNTSPVLTTPDIGAAVATSLNAIGNITSGNSLNAGNGTVNSILSYDVSSGYTGTSSNHSFTLKTNNTDRYVIGASGGHVFTGAGSFTGNLTANNLSGTNTGDQTTITGNAGTATALQTARTISGVAFDGTSNITLNNTGITNGAGYITSSALSGYAPLASPALTGNPTAPTQSQGDNSTKIATTAYTDNAVGGGFSFYTRTNSSTQLSASDFQGKTTLVGRGNAASNNVEFVLPQASTWTGKIIYVKKIDSSGNNVTVTGWNNTELIDGATTRSISMQYGVIQMYSNGSTIDIL